MQKYEIHVSSKDMLGFNFLDNVIALAAKGAVVKDKTLPFMKFPFSVKMTIETDEEPVADPFIRVFNADTLEEIKPKPVVSAPVEVNLVESGSFSLEASDDSKGVKEKLSKEALEALTWDEFREECKIYGITGRDKKVMTTKYLDK